MLQEVEDLLSLTDDVLCDVYLHHPPPCSDVIRLPPSLWSRVHSDVTSYLRDVDEGYGTVVSWSHPIFKKIAAERYFNQGKRYSHGHVKIFLYSNIHIYYFI